MSNLDRAEAASRGGARTLVVLFTLLLCEVLSLATGWVGFGYGAQASFLALCLVAMGSTSLRERSLMGIALGLAAVLLWQGKGTEALGSALSLGAFFGAFIATLTAMRDIAARSASVLDVGQYLTSQPAGRRFYATAFGGHFLAVFLNFGAVSLMAPLVQKSAVHADGRPFAALERRQISALIRGFAWLLLWAPTTLSQAVLLTIFTEVTLWDIVPIGLATAVGFTVLGRLYDRYEWRGQALPGPVASPDFPRRAAWVVSGICALLIGATFAGSLLFQASIAQTLLFVVPVVTFGWFLGQEWHAPRAPLQHLPVFAGVLKTSAGSLARSAIALGLSGFIGRAAGQALPVETIAQTLNVAALPGWLFLAILPALITLGGQIALSPILIVVFLGELLGAMQALPTGQAQILYALSMGWALSMTASPNATATLLISGTTNIAPTTLTWRWNLRYGLLCYIFALPIFAIIA